MRIKMFYHSIVSDWNHGNAHFLRGVVTELISRGHIVEVFEPEGGWSFSNLIEQSGHEQVEEFYQYYPGLKSHFYKLEENDLEMLLSDAELVIVHEWNDHELVRRIGEVRKNEDFKLLFHDTHHRSLTEPENMAAYDLSNYDGILTFGNVIRDIYIKEGWAENVWTWHEAADVRVFHPVEGVEKVRDLIWIGNWGDEERTRELIEFLIEPSSAMGLSTRVHGVRYPSYAVEALEKAGIEYAGWIPNYKVPDAFAASRITVHVPRRPYVEALKGIPTIRPFEAMACGIPLISAPWEDSEGLFNPGKDFLTAASGNEMKEMIRLLLNEPDFAAEMAEHALRTILSRHTCSHRADELLNICRSLGVETDKSRIILNRE